MSRTMNSQALVLLDRMLGLSGPGGEQYTTLDDGNVQQVLEISDVARRSLTPAGSAGVFTIMFENYEAGSTGVSSNVIDPYNFANELTVNFDTNGYPVPVPLGFDVWVIQASAYTYDPSDFAWLQLSMVYPAKTTALTSRINAGGAEAQIGNNISYHHLVRWDTQLPGDVVTGADQQYVWATENGSLTQKIGTRVPRGGTLHFITDASVAGNYAFCNVILGLFPEGLGQDIAT